MKKPFNKIVGPGGEWIDDDGAKKPEGSSGNAAVEGIDARDEFLLRCLNAAVNLRGVMTFAEFCDLYNEYAESHEPPVSDPLDEDELDGFMSRLANCREGDGSPLDWLLDEFGLCFACWRDARDGANLVVRRTLLEVDEDIRTSETPPMGDVYLSLGTIHPANFENPATILKIVMTHLGLPTELPIRLSFADQARFAAETIRRIDANGKFANVVMG